MAAAPAGRTYNVHNIITHEVKVVEDVHWVGVEEFVKELAVKSGFNRINVLYDENGKQLNTWEYNSIQNNDHVWVRNNFLYEIKEDYQDFQYLIMGHDQAEADHIPEALLRSSGWAGPQTIPISYPSETFFPFDGHICQSVPLYLALCNTVEEFMDPTGHRLRRANEKGTHIYQNIILVYNCHDGNSWKFLVDRIVPELLERCEIEENNINVAVVGFHDPTAGAPTVPFDQVQEYCYEKKWIPMEMDPHAREVDFAGIFVNLARLSMMDGNCFRKVVYSCCTIS